MQGWGDGGRRNVSNTVNGRVELLFSSLNLRHCCSDVLMLIIAFDIVADW